MKKAPQAYEVKNRRGLWAAKGIDPVTRKRKNYFGNSASEASRKAEMSLGECQDHSLFAFYSTVYLPVVKHRSRNWLEQIAWAMDRYVLPNLGHRDIRELKRADLQLFFNKIGAKLKTSSVARIKIVLSGIMRLAQADEVINSNPVSFVRLPRPDPVEKTVLTFNELRVLLDSAGPLVRPFIILAGGAGLRLGEAVGVTRGAIGKDGMLRVRQQVQQLKGGCVVRDQLKTDQSRREIPLPRAMLEALLHCHQVSDIWICSDSIGGFVKPKNITRELQQLASGPMSRS